MATGIGTQRCFGVPEFPKIHEALALIEERVRRSWRLLFSLREQRHGFGIQMLIKSRYPTLIGACLLCRRGKADGTNQDRRKDTTSHSLLPQHIPFTSAVFPCRARFHSTRG